MEKREIGSIGTIGQYIGMWLEKNRLKEEIEEIEEEMKNMEESIIDTVVSPVTLHGHTISVETRRQYGDWPKDIQQKIDELKELKDRAKRVGNVSYEIKRSLQVK